MEEALQKQDAELMQIVTFSIGEEEFGVDILKVQEIIRMMEITKVPRGGAAPAGCLRPGIGVHQRRG